MHRVRSAILLLGLCSLSATSCAVLRTDDKPGYVVFFTERSAVIDTAANSTIAAAAHEAVTSGQAVAVVGWTDSAGSPSADVILSELRARLVAETLAADGVPTTRIVRRGRGQTNEDPGVASRRVNIEIGG